MNNGGLTVRRIAGNEADYVEDAYRTYPDFMEVQYVRKPSLTGRTQAKAQQAQFR